MTLKGFIEYLIDNKGFVVIAGNLYRCVYCGISGDGGKRTISYHVEDLEYKWNRYNQTKPFTSELLKLTLLGLDISLRTESEQAYIRSRM